MLKNVLGSGRLRCVRRGVMSSHRVGPQAADAAAQEADASAVPGSPAASRLAPYRRFVRCCISLFGVASLAFLMGAAVMFFELPSSSFLRGAFVGGAAWYEQKQAPKHLVERRPALADPTFTIGRIDKPAETCDGFTLCMCSGGTRATLINMRGDVVHQWR